jgi:hypothetical protein
MADRTRGPDLAAAPPPAVRFQAEHSNDCWQFDLSPSDLKQVPAPLWVEAGRSPPTLMPFSVVDDRSGVAYQEPGEIKALFMQTPKADRTRELKEQMLAACQPARKRDPRSACKRDPV